jgi:hypothetical protein
MANNPDNPPPSKKLLKFLTKARPVLTHGPQGVTSYVPGQSVICTTTGGVLMTTTPVYTISSALAQRRAASRQSDTSAVPQLSKIPIPTATTTHDTMQAGMLTASIQPWPRQPGDAFAEIRRHQQVMDQRRKERLARHATNVTYVAQPTGQLAASRPEFVLGAPCTPQWLPAPSRYAHDDFTIAGEFRELSLAPGQSHIPRPLKRAQRVYSELDRVATDPSQQTYRPTTDPSTDRYLYTSFRPAKTTIRPFPSEFGTTLTHSATVPSAGVVFSAAPISTRARDPFIQRPINTPNRSSNFQHLDGQRVPLNPADIAQVHRSGRVQPDLTMNKDPQAVQLLRKVQFTDAPSTSTSSADYSQAQLPRGVTETESVTVSYSNTGVSQTITKTKVRMFGTDDESPPPTTLDPPLLAWQQRSPTPPRAHRRRSPSPDDADVANASMQVLTGDSPRLHLLRLFPDCKHEIPCDYDCEATRPNSPDDSEATESNPFVFAPPVHEEELQPPLTFRQDDIQMIRLGTELIPAPTQPTLYPTLPPQSAEGFLLDEGPASDPTGAKPKPKRKSKVYTLLPTPERRQTRSRTAQQNVALECPAPMAIMRDRLAPLIVRPSDPPVVRGRGRPRRVIYESDVEGTDQEQ